ncbi:MAG: sodium:calcium antiporter, partial [Thalassobaculaceae bacterium]
MTFAVCSVVAGLVLLFLGAEVMIRGAVALSRALKVSPHVIGLTVIAFGTSAPELFVSMKAALSGAPAIAVGNVVGSNLANILLMIGTVGVIAPIACNSPNLRREGAALIGATAIFLGASVTGHIGPILGAAMVAALIAYLLLCYRMDLAEGDASVFARE